MSDPDPDPDLEYGSDPDPDTDLRLFPEVLKNTYTYAYAVFFHVKMTSFRKKLLNEQVTLVNFKSVSVNIPPAKVYTKTIPSKKINFMLLKQKLTSQVNLRNDAHEK